MNSIVTPQLKATLIKKATANEVASFIERDPSLFMHKYKNKKDQEVAAFIAAQFSYGNRAQFMPKVEALLSLSKDQPFEWIKQKGYAKQIKASEEKFYRFNSFTQLLSFLDRLNELIVAYGTLEKAFKTHYQHLQKENEQANASDEERSLAIQKSVCQLFVGCDLVATNYKSACKRINMFFRWMVRKNSPVDLGIWNWVDPNDLIIPLDTHVLHNAIVLGILPKEATASAKTACQLTSILAEVFPGDPVKGDFALFDV